MRVTRLLVIIRAILRTRINDEPCNYHSCRKAKSRGVWSFISRLVFRQQTAIPFDGIGDARHPQYVPQRRLIARYHRFLEIALQLVYEFEGMQADATDEDRLS